MMPDEANLAAPYRRARRDFIAAVTVAGSDAIARVHPRRGPDGKPLFCDSAAFGPRGAARALVLVDGPLVALLQKGFKLPEGVRLVMVHAPDPFLAAWGRPGEPSDWPQKTLAAIAAEDLARVKKLTLLGGGAAAKTALAGALPQAALHGPGKGPEPGMKAILAAIAAL